MSQIDNILGPSILQTWNNANQKRETGEIQRAQGLMQIQGLLAKRQQEQRTQQEVDAIKGVMSQNSGNPQAQLQGLLNLGTPTAAAMAQQLKGMIPKPAEPYTLAPGGQRRGVNNEILAEAPMRPTQPREFAPPEIVRLQQTLDKLPPDSPMRGALSARIKMLTERPAGVTVNMPQSSDLMQKPDGSYVRVRIGKNGAVEEVPLGNVQPPKSASERAAEAKAAAAQAEDTATVESVRQRVAKMSALIQGNTGVVGPAGIARRMGETAVGVVAPGIPTPAIDYDNEKNLMVSDIRKLIEKDPNLSNQERETMYKTLGGGTMQTPGSAVRTMNNVLSFIEGKKLRGPSRNQGPAVGAVVDGYRFKGGNPADQANWEKQ